MTERFIEVKGKGQMQGYLLDEKYHKRAPLSLEEMKEMVEQEKQKRDNQTQVLLETKEHLQGEEFTEDEQQ